jgi:hypothetical protein
MTDELSSALAALRRAAWRAALAGATEDQLADALRLGVTRAHRTRVDVLMPAPPR